MIVILSPAKKLDFDTVAPVQEYSESEFLKISNKLIKQLKKLEPKEISKLMKLSDSLTELNIQRYQKFKTPFSLKNAKQAIYSFKGDTYVGFDADSMTKNQVKLAQKNIRILSGLYGILSPLDLIQPYRLEMGTKFDVDGKKNLQLFWKEVLTQKLNNDFSSRQNKTLINLASKEYFSAIDFKVLDAKVITPQFKEKKGDEFKIVSFYAKKARGMMARYIVDEKVSKLEDLKNFNRENYKYNSKLSTELVPVFTR